MIEEAQRLKLERDEWAMEQTAALVANKLGPVIVSAAKAINQTIVNAFKG